MAITLNGTNGVTFPDSSLQAAAASPYVLKNRIINGDMGIDQRNAGASVTVTDSTKFPVDRFDCIGQATDGVFTAQQSTTAPAGFKNSLVCTVTTADSSIGSTQFYLLRQNIEGFNCSDLGWGTANAQTVTLSFWVRSSLTGTFGGAVRNSAQNRSYPFSYTISAANTWEQKSVTITGDTSGTWLTDNGRGIILNWSLGDGSSRLGTAGAWSGTNYSGATGQVNLIGTSGATFYITGVQLEVGTSATPFERRLYNQELANCQRYLPSSGTTSNYYAGVSTSTTNAYAPIPLPVPARVAPTGITIASGTYYWLNGSGSQNTATVVFNSAGYQGGMVQITTTGATTGQAGLFNPNGATILWTGCEL